MQNISKPVPPLPPPGERLTITYNGKLLTVEPHQLEHYHRIKRILEQNLCYIDGSEMGTGKMIMAIAIAMTWGFPLLVICPKNVKSTWIRETKKYGVTILSVDGPDGEDTETGVIGYDALRSTKGHQPKHGLLRRYDHPEKGAIFTATDKFKQMAESGMLLIIDEFQKVKNDVAQYHACRALTTACLSIGNQTRIGLLSATPLDKEEQAINTLRLMGYIQHPQLYRYERDLLRLTLLGAQELIDTCKRMDVARTQNVLETFPLDHKNVPELCFELFVNVITARILSMMPPQRIGVEKDVKNGYYNMTPEEEVELGKSVTLLNQVAHYDPKTQTYDRRQANWGAIKHAHMGCEAAKIGLVTRLSRGKLMSDPLCKVIVFVNYTDTIHRLTADLAEFHPMVMYGATKEKDRDDIMDSFRVNDEFRLLIVNITVGNVGVSLDDRLGDRPRYMFIIPTYSLQDLHQATGRIHRHGTKSKATIRFIYGKIHKRETSILNALSRKSDVLRRVLQLQNEYGIRFPGEYQDEFEDGPLGGVGIGPLAPTAGILGGQHQNSGPLIVREAA